MTPAGKRYKKEYARELVKIATGDLESASALASAKLGRPENVCYLAQQAVEKCLKAMLCHLELKVIHTHDIETLCNLIPDAHKPDNIAALSALTEYATVRRYEEGYEIISPEDLKLVLQTATAAVFWAKKMIG